MVADVVALYPYIIILLQFTVKSLPVPKFEHCSINKMTLAVLLLTLSGLTLKLFLAYACPPIEPPIYVTYQ